MLFEMPMPYVNENPMNPTCKACQTPLSPKESLGQKNGYDTLPCSSCGTVTVHPFPSVETLMDFYQSYKGSTDYRAKRDKKIRRAKSRLIRLMPMAPGKTFLDVGCNYGFTVAAALGLGLDAHGIDIDGTAVAAAKNAYGTDRFTVASIQNFAKGDKKFDIAYTSEVIEHVPDPDAFIGSISKVLNKGGVLYLTTPDRGHFAVPRDFTKWKEVRPPEHIVFFTRKGLRQLLEKHGFKVEKFFFSLKPGMRLIARKI